MMRTVRTTLSYLLLALAVSSGATPTSAVTSEDSLSNYVEVPHYSKVTVTVRNVIPALMNPIKRAEVEAGILREGRKQCNRAAQKYSLDVRYPKTKPTHAFVQLPINASPSEYSRQEGPNYIVVISYCNGVWRRIR